MNGEIDIKKRTTHCPYCGGADPEIVNWMEENSHRLLVVRGRMGVKRFRFGSLLAGEYTWHDPPHPTMRQAVIAAIAFDNNNNGAQKK